MVADPSRGWSNVLVQCVSVGMQVRFCFCSTPFTLRAQVTIEVPFPKGTSARALAVAIGKTRISIGMKGQPPVLEGEFPSSEEAVQYTVKLSESTWYLGASLSFFFISYAMVVTGTQCVITHIGFIVSFIWPDPATGVAIVTLFKSLPKDVWWHQIVKGAREIDLEKVRLALCPMYCFQQVASVVLLSCMCMNRLNRTS